VRVEREAYQLMEKKVFVCECVRLRNEEREERVRESVHTQD